ncbi:hypothetical protein TorRG33x02_349370 [Trema orientale]|uniref:Uncharacterized protein n=1 Tax=Trema orientale TaxID=63057 RepID=A0A2P5AIR0_TREOI|nr:hypothetical protein TorRG33x02_349370 [Trema orientale]
MIIGEKQIKDLGEKRHDSQGGGVTDKQNLKKVVTTTKHSEHEIMGCQIVDSTHAGVVVGKMLNKGDNLKVVEFGGPKITLEKGEIVSSSADGENNRSRTVESTRHKGIGDTVVGYNRKSNNEDELILSQSPSITQTLELPYNQVHLSRKPHDFPEHFPIAWTILKTALKPYFNFWAR